MKYISDLPVPTEEETHTNNFIHVFRGSSSFDSLN